MFFSSFVLLFFLLQMIAIIFDDAIYLFIYFLHLFQCYCVQVPYQKLFRKSAREMKKQQLYNSKQIIIILPMKYERRYHNICRRRGGLVVNTSDTGSRGRWGSSPSWIAVLCPCARYIYPPKLLVIPRKRWLRPNMTEKLFTGTLSLKKNQNQ